jgi:hypothetical protein
MDTVKILETIVKKLEEERKLWYGNSGSIVISATNDVLDFTKLALEAAIIEQKEQAQS